MLRVITLSSFLFFYAIITFAWAQPFYPSAISQPYAFDKTIPLRDMNINISPGAAMVRDDKVVPNKDGIRKVIESKKIPIEFGQDDVVQAFFGTSQATSTPIANFDGVNNRNGVLPPDTQGDVGPNHYVQMVNLSFQIWDKKGNSLYGPANNSVLWNGFGDPWDGSNDGDPIVLYDELADRWLFSQFALPNYPNGPFYILIAITETGDPTGSWYRYGYAFDDMPDYPKFAVWPDGYYMTVNQFAHGSLNWAGAGVIVFERELMLAGNPNASMIFWDFSASDDPWSMLPSDFDGPPPPMGTPNYLAYFNDDSWGYSSDHLRILECNVSWSNPSSSTITGPTILDTSPFKSNFTAYFTSRGNIPQPGTTRRLDALSSRLLFRLQYRNFGIYKALVTNHTVNVATSGNQAGVRWYELRNTGSGWSIFQQGTYAPDNDSRWMGSAAMDGYGNIALGYSVSSSSTYPSIRYTGRMRDDPPGQMTIAEQTIISGSGSQTHSASRWGDYSMMSVDPIDDATFWYTNEYIQTTGSAPWKTRIASFTFGVDLDLRILLEGAYSGSGQMTTQLNSSNVLPNEQPYNSSPWNYNGVEKVTSGYFADNPDIIDWVLIELRTGTASTSAVARRAALLNKYGKVVGLDGTDPLRFGLPPGSYHIVIRHRNHLAVMSSSAVALDDSPSPPTLYDFSSGSTQFWGGTAGAVQVDTSPTFWGMFAGDANQNGKINYNGPSNDKNSILTEVGLTTPNNIVYGYSKNDTNLDGGVTYNGPSNDKNVILKSVGLLTPNNEILTQVP